MVDTKIKKIPNEQLLIERLKSGKEAALKQIFDLYWYQMYVTAKNKLQSEENAKLVVKEVFFTLWNTRKIIKIDNLSEYLFTTLKFKILDMVKKQLDKS